MIKNIQHSFLTKAISPLLSPWKGLKALALAALLLVCAAGTIRAQSYPSIDNPSTCADCVPLGWSIMGGSPDVISGNEPHPALGFGNISGISGPSPHGGRMLMLRSISGFEDEEASTAISGLTPGFTYEASFYVQGASTSGQSGTFSGGTLIVTIGTEQFSLLLPFSTAGSDDWQLITVSFTAVGTTANLLLKCNSVGAITAPNGGARRGAIVVDGGGPGSVTLSSINVANTCPVTTVNLSSLYTATPPAGTSLVWYDGEDPLTATLVPDPAAVGSSGTYYAFYYDNENNCHSPASIPVVVTIEYCDPCDDPDVLEFAQGDGNPAGVGPVQDTSIRFRHNTDNPTGNTFETYDPAVTINFELTNQQYTLSGISTGYPVNIGYQNAAGGSPIEIFRALNTYGAPLNNWFTSYASPAGEGITTADNYGIVLNTTTSPLRAAGAATSGVAHHMADLVITFSQPVNNPVLHLGGLGSRTPLAAPNQLGFSQEYDLIASNVPVTLTKLSGSNVFTVSGTRIQNTAATGQMNSTGTNNSGSGSVKITGTGITTLTLRVSVRGDGTLASTTSWSESNTSIGSGDGATLSFSIGYCEDSSSSPCTKPGAVGTALTSSVGILTKGDPSIADWPESVPNGYLVLDAAQKGMVITHMTTTQRDALVPVEGMMIYNTTESCVQLYRGASPLVDAARTGWNCIEQGCNSTPLAPRNVRVAYTFGGFNFVLNHAAFRSQLENSDNYGTAGTFKGATGFEFTLVTLTDNSVTPAYLKENFDMIVTGYFELSTGSAEKVKEFTDLGGVAFALMDYNVGNNLNTAFGGSGNMSPLNSPWYQSRTLNNSVSNGIFGNGGGATIVGAENGSTPPAGNIPADSQIIGYLNRPDAASEDYVSVYITGSEGRAIFVYDEGIFRNGAVAGTVIDTTQEIFIHNLMAYALKKVGFSAE